MIKFFFNWLFHKSKTLQQLHLDRLKVHSVKVERENDLLFDESAKKLLSRLKEVLEINQNRSLRRKWNRILNNENSPFYVLKSGN